MPGFYTSFKSALMKGTTSMHRSAMSATSSQSSTKHADTPVSDKSSGFHSEYVEPQSPPPVPSGGLLQTASDKVLKIMDTKLDMDKFVEEKVEFYKTRHASTLDRVVVYVCDRTAPPGGIWSCDLCVRAGREGGGIHHGSLGSMLPYFKKNKDEKMGTYVLLRRKNMQMREEVDRFLKFYKTQVSNSRATHVFMVTYKDGAQVLLNAMRENLSLIQRQLSGIGFIDSDHKMEEQDDFAIRKLVAQWSTNWMPSSKSIGSRLTQYEAQKGCVCFSGGCDDNQVEMLRFMVPSIFAAFKARWSGFRVASRSNGTETKCYNCERPFTMRRWRQHCRTCHNAVCEACSSSELTKQEGQVRLCIVCKSLPSLIHWSRPRAVRSGQKRSVFEASTVPGKLGIEDFELLQIIGKGACGKVLLVQKIENPCAKQLFAMKVLKKDWVLNKDLVNQTMAERRILQDANHPFIVQLRFAFQNQDKLYMVMDYYSGGSLRSVLRRRGRFSINRAKFYLAEVLLAIAHLHSLNIIYRDIKLENIVCTADGHVACTDFGLSKEDMTDTSRTKSFVGTCEYLAPELLKKKGYGKYIDWWSFGILTFEMIQGDAPFRHKVPASLFEKILTEQPVFTDRFTPEAIDLVKKLLVKNPKNRLGCGEAGAEDIKSHPFFAGTDWDAIYAKTAIKPSLPHRPQDVTDASNISRAIIKTLESREEIMPDSPVVLAKSPSATKHFDRFSYVGENSYPNITLKFQKEATISEELDDDEV